MYMSYPIKTVKLDMQFFSLRCSYVEDENEVLCALQQFACLILNKWSVYMPRIMSVTQIARLLSYLVIFKYMSD
jgi:hypothetical protein